MLPSGTERSSLSSATTLLNFLLSWLHSMGDSLKLLVSFVTFVPAQPLPVLRQSFLYVGQIHALLFGFHCQLFQLAFEQARAFGGSGRTRRRNHCASADMDFK